MQEEKRRPPLKRKRIKNKTLLHYFLLFAMVFSAALITLTYFVELYSPKVDVAIGNNESLTLNDDTEYKNIDERLKWIQMEDELPTVALKNKEEKEKKYKNDKDEHRNLNEKINKTDKKEKDKESEKSFNLYKSNLIEDVEKEKKKNKEIKKTIKEEVVAPKPVLIEKIPVASNKKSSIVERTYKTNTEDDTGDKLKKRTAIIEPVVIKTIPVSKPTKVFVGHFNTVEEAIKVQRKLSMEESEIVPFTKYINGQYIIQAGSFSDKEKASALVSRLKSKGYDAKIE